MIAKITRPRLEAFLKAHANTGYTLDIGSGGSYYHYDRFFPNRLTADIDPARNPEVVADIHALPFEDKTFEVVVCVEVLEHVIDPVRAICEMHRVLKPGGTLILTTRFVYPIHDAPHDYWRYTKYNLSRLFSAWDLETLQAETHPMEGIAVLLQRVAYQTRLRFNAPAKLLLFALAWILSKLNWLVVKEYGDIKKSTEEKDFLTTGYYIVARKR